MDKTQVWKQAGWMNCYELYQKLISHLTTDLGFLCTFASTIDPSETDQFARFIVHIFTAANCTLPLIKTMIINEFTKASSEGEGSILRGNNVINKVEGVYVRSIGQAYLRSVLGDLLIKIINERDLDLEVDPRKINQNNEDDIYAITGFGSSSKFVMSDSDYTATLKNNQRRLVETAQMFLDRITDPAMLDEMPREIRAVASFTADCAQKYAPDSINPLIGGFVMLRFFTPAIATPESSKLLPPDLVVSFKCKRNLVLLAKVLQNASNGVLFGAKEDFMTCMNEFILENKPKMHEYFARVIAPNAGAPVANMPTAIPPTKIVPLTTVAPPSPPQATRRVVLGQRSAVSPVIERSASSTSMTIGRTGLTSSGGVPSVATPSSPSEVNLRQMDLQELFDLHRVLEQSQERIEKKYKDGSNFTHGNINASEAIFNILGDLGPSPKTRNSSKKAKDADVVESDPLIDLSSATSSTLVFDDVMGLLEKARFLYQGPDDKQGNPVFYLIVNRIKVEFLNNVNPLVSHIFKVMDATVNCGYSLVIDMSWANVNNEMQRAIYTHLPKLAKIFSRKYKKNVIGVWVVHPSAYTRAVVHFMRLFTSRKLKRKINEVYNWKQLGAQIDLENIMLPETSKDYITKLYNVVKVNAKNKKQERFIKFTPNSLLNIDPKAKKIQNERKIDEIQEIASSTGSNEITMRFKEGTAPAHKGLFNLKSDKDLLFRRYTFNGGVQERDGVLQDIFESGFKMFWAKPPPEFRVIKVNQAGKRQERTFKLTIDSLLNLDNSGTIKSEVSFAGIEEVTMDSGDMDVIWLKLKAEPFKRKVICVGNARLLMDNLNEAALRYTRVSEEQESILKQEYDNQDNNQLLDS